jgi:phage terminase large subunit-like protein
MWPNKAVGHIFGANFFDQLRGPQFDLVWIDEMAKFSHPDLVWQQVDMALRLGTFPRCIITTTPRPIKILQDLVQDSTCVVTTGSTFDNAANLAPSFLAHMKKTYSHTSLGQQELYGKILTQREGALWSRSMFRYEHVNIDRLRRLVIAVDPAITCHAQSDETGIVVVGQTEDGTGVLINDLSGKFPPSDWSRKVVEAYWYYKADRVVAEMNRGGDMVEKMIKSVDPTVSFKGVRATRGKIIRAEPVAALYEQKKVVHLQCFERLEEQLCHYTHDTTGYSPDRLDALVWGLSEIFLTHPTQEIRVWG